MSDSRAASSPDALNSADEQEAALRGARRRFIESFPDRLAALEQLAAAMEDTESEGPVAAMRHVAHKVAGLAGMIGLPTVSRRALELEQQIETRAPVGDLRRGIEALSAAFDGDRTSAPPAWASPAVTSNQPVNVLLIASDLDERRKLVAALRAGGYRVAQIVDTSTALQAAQQMHPGLIVLDVDMPDADGYVLCRQLKADPALASTPVICLSARPETIKEHAGLLLAADDYIAKPCDPSELQLRMRRLLQPQPAPRKPAATPPAHPPAASSPAIADYDSFVTTATDLFARGPAALVLVRAGGRRVEVAEVLAQELRGKDFIGRYSDAHLVVLLPDMTAATAADRIEGVIGLLRTRGLGDVAAGVAQDGRGASLEQLLADADMALSAARVGGKPVAVAGQTTAAAAVTSEKPTAKVLIVDDDPDVTHIVDPRLRAAGMQTVLAFDGAQALDTIAREAPDLVLLDLMMPKLTGFDVLARLRDQPPPRPRVIVVSSRGREDDVTRAFELGADDYISKPFSPAELIARVVRLLR